MKKKLIYSALLSMFVLKADKLYSIYHKPVSGLDPMKLFRSPQSLTELLHEGLVEIESLANQQNFEQVQIVLDSLNDAYDQKVDSLKIHAVYRDDREFLQNLIDRIDSMIQELEGSRQLSAESLDILRNNTDMLRVLRTKIVG